LETYVLTKAGKLESGLALSPEEADIINSPELRELDAHVTRVYISEANRMEILGYILQHCKLSWRDARLAHEEELIKAMSTDAPPQTTPPEPCAPAELDPEAFPYGVNHLTNAPEAA